MSVSKRFVSGLATKAGLACVTIVPVGCVRIALPQGFLRLLAKLKAKRTTLVRYDANTEEALRCR